MKLEPIAKPIKIRIMIGGNEYSDLESVKRDFSIKDLFPLFKDGRLERWLKQIGENELAQKVGELSNQCRDKCEHDDGHAHIQFLSLFFDDVEKSLSEYENKSEGEWSFKDYLLSMSSETIFKRPQFFELIDGEMLSGRVKTKKDYKKIFEFLKLSKNKPECKDIISKFYSECEKKGYQWDMAFGKKDLSLDDIVYFYQNECFHIPTIDWGKLFADYVKNWSTDSEKIEAIIKDNSNHKESFYEHCAKKGFEEAKKRLDPWDFLANSKDYELVIRAIKRWKAVGIDNKKTNFNYQNLETPLGKQILEFLSNIRAFDAASWHQNYDDSEYYLKDEREVMKCIQSCPISGPYRLIDPKTEKTLRDMAIRGVELATYALNSRGRFNYEFRVSDHVVDQFHTKLRSKKKDIV